MDFCFGGTQNIPWSACQNILLSVLNALSSLHAEYSSASCIIFLLCFPSAGSTHTQARHVPLSLFPISEPTQAGVAFICADLQYFCWMTPWHQQINCNTRIYQISRRIWHLWVLFFFPILHGTYSASSVLASPLTPVRKSWRFYPSYSEILRKAGHKASILSVALTNSAPLGGLQEIPASWLVLDLHTAQGSALMYASTPGITGNTNHQIPSGKMTAGTSVKGFPLEQDVCALCESQSVKTAKTMGKNS